MTTTPVPETVPTHHNGDVEKTEQEMCTCARCIALALQHANGEVMMAQQHLEIALRAGPRPEGDKGAGDRQSTSSDDLTDELELRRRQLQLERARELQKHIQNQMGLFQFWVQQLYSAHRSQERNMEEDNRAKSAPFMITPYTHQWLISGTHRAPEQGAADDASDGDENEDGESSILSK